MIYFRNRPKGNYVNEANWQDLHILTENWKNDLELHLRDIDFLERLFDSYFVKLIPYQNLRELNDLKQDIKDSKIRCQNILEYTQDQLTYIGNLIEDLHKYDSYVFRSAYELFEDEISAFLLKVKEVRIIVFAMIKEVFKNEKPIHMWKFN